MLVLSRKERERIVFTSLGITIDVVKISGRRVRLVIQAPPDIPVHRKEVAERMATRTDDSSKVAKPSIRPYTTNPTTEVASAGFQD